MSFIVFIVEDDLIFQTYIKEQVPNLKEIEYHYFNTAQACIEALHLKPNLISIDVRLPDINGSKLLQKLQDKLTDTPIIAISAQDSVHVTIELFKNGLYDYFIKDELAIKRLNNLILTLYKKNQLTKEINELKGGLKKEGAQKVLIGNSKALKNILKNIQIASSLDFPIFIHGSSGTGKDTVAELIHQTKRNALPFIKLPVLSYSADVLEHIFFDFNNPSSKHNVFEQAKNGTVYIDEITGLDRNLQLKLANFFDPMNNSLVSFKNYKCKLIFSSTKDLEAETLNKNFSQELYYKIKGFNLHLPDLIERENDLLLIAQHFIDSCCKKNRIKRKKLHDNTIKKLTSHNFRGNITELQSIIELGVSLSTTEYILPEHLHFNIQQQSVIESTKTLKELTIQIIKARLLHNNNNVIKTAKELEISKSSIYSLINAGKL